LQTPFEFFERAIDDGQRDHRGRKDAVVIVELPCLIHPLVKSVDHVVDQVGVILHPLLDQAGQRWEHQRVIQAEFVHHLQPGSGITEGWDGLHWLTDHLAVGLAATAGAEVFLLSTGPRHDVEGGVRDVFADVVAHHDLCPAAHLHILDSPLPVVRQELRECLLGLVEVVVGVEYREGKLA
jgi:hypothetical protein